MGVGNDDQTAASRVVIEKIRDAIEWIFGGNQEGILPSLAKGLAAGLSSIFGMVAATANSRRGRKRLTKYKLLVEMKERDFEYSVFGYGFVNP